MTLPSVIFVKSDRMELDGIIDVGDARESLLEDVLEEDDLKRTRVRAWTKTWVTVDGTKLRVLKWVPGTAQVLTLLGTDRAEFSDLSKLRREQLAANKRLMNDRAPVTRSVSTVLRKRTLRSNDPEGYEWANLQQLQKAQIYGRRRRRF